jgi:hypothetical protein
METLDRAAYRATGMRGNGTVSSDGLWSIWTMRRLQAHITSLAHTNPHDDLVTASTLLDGVHALLSGLVYRAQGAAREREECRVIARQHIESAQMMMPAADSTPSRDV